MPHKHCTRTMTNSIQKKLYTYDTSSNLSSDSSDPDYSDNSSDCSDCSDCSDYSDNSDNSDCSDNKNFSKNDYYKFLHKLYPSQYSKNKYIGSLHEVKKDDNQHKRAKNTHVSNSDHVNNDMNTHNIFNSKIIKKKHNKIYKKNNSDDESNEDTNTSYKKSLISEGFNTLFHNIHKSDKNINIIVNLEKGKNKIYNNTNDTSNGYRFIEGEEGEEGEECDEEDIEDEIKSKKSLQQIFKGSVESINKDDIIPAPQKISNKNYKIFDKILCTEEKESEYFKNCLSKNLQLEAIAKLEKLKEITKISKPYLLHLVDLDIPDQYKACALRKINIMRLMSGSGNSEYYKIKTWVDNFLKIPFNKYNNLPISFADGIEQCHDFMENAKKILDSVTYGLEDAKIQIMQLIGLWLVNPNAIGCAIAIKGPPGTGKTTLIKEGISKILNRPFALIALGGCGDSGFIDGFDYTYEGSKHGKIIDILIQCGCMNPIILFDELDKLSDSFKGQEITGVLTHLTDSTQNSKFCDKYFSEITIDMSKALFIFSYNDEAAVNPILKDRMYKIETKGYKTKDKLIIAKDYLLPKIREEIKFDNGAIVFSDEILEYIINDFTEKEDGVRNLKRCLEIVYKKLNLYRLMKPNVNLFENSEGFKFKTKITWPCILTKQLIDDLINKASTKDIPYGMYT